LFVPDVTNSLWSRRFTPISAAFTESRRNGSGSFLVSRYGIGPVDNSEQNGAKTAFAASHMFPSAGR
jgi:hypothetical protein